MVYQDALVIRQDKVSWWKIHTLTQVHIGALTHTFVQEIVCLCYRSRYCISDLVNSKTHIHMLGFSVSC